MKTRYEATFVGATMNPQAQRRKPLPEIIFLGRSNVGKSSLINCLVNHKKLARTSSTPGKTRLFYFYEVDHRFLFVDPPGYGYAKVAKTVRNRWIKVMERYLRNTEMLLGAVLIMDFRWAPTPIDYEMARWLADREIPAVFAMNKADKLSRKNRVERLRHAAAQLNFPNAGRIIPFSAHTKEGRGPLWQVIESWTENLKTGAN